jgi:pyruvate/2-oxoacid:ferredoxin oxidoreductase beta subunit
LIAKVHKASLINGPAYVGISSFCPQVMGAPAHDFLRLSRLELDARLFTLCEAERIPGANTVRYTLNYAPHRFVPVKELFTQEKIYRDLARDDELVAEHQQRVDQGWRLWNPVFGANGLPVMAAA